MSVLWDSWDAVPRPEDGTTRELTKEDDVWFRGSGCAPTCHFCLRPIAIGEAFGFRRFDSVPVNGRTFTLRAMACGACTQYVTPQALERVRLESLETLKKVLR